MHPPLVLRIPVEPRALGGLFLQPPAETRYVRRMFLARPAVVLFALATFAAGGCAGNPSAVQQAGQVSCWNVSSAQSPMKTYCRTEEQWAQFLAAANVQCMDGPPVRGLCPEHWKENQRVRRFQHMSAYDESNLNPSGDGIARQYVMPYMPLMPDGFVWTPPAVVAAPTQ